MNKVGAPVASFISEGESYVNNQGQVSHTNAVATPFDHASSSSGMDPEQKAFYDRQNESWQQRSIQQGATGSNPYAKTSASSSTTTGSATSSSTKSTTSTSTGEQRDANGRLTRDLDGNVYTYNDKGQIQTVTSPNGQVITYTWDAAGINSTMSYSFKTGGVNDAKTLTLEGDNNDPNFWAQAGEWAQQNWEEYGPVVMKMKEAYDSILAVPGDPTELYTAVEDYIEVNQMVQALLQKSAAGGNRMSQAFLNNQQLPQRIVNEASDSCSIS